MSVAPQFNLMSVAEYLATEEQSPVRREYLGGVVYAMSGGTTQHARVASNVLLALGMRLRGSRCEAFGPDMKVRIQLPTHVRFYYPDAMVVCHPNPAKEVFQDRPVVIVEVLSPSTRRTDDSEKRDAYLTISSLALYLMVEQDGPAVVAWRRGEQGFQREVYAGIEQTIPVPELGFELPLAELYERVDFSPDDA